MFEDGCMVVALYYPGRGESTSYEATTASRELSDLLQPSAQSGIARYVGHTQLTTSVHEGRANVERMLQQSKRGCHLATEILHCAVPIV